MENVLVLATSFLDDLMTHPTEEGKARRMLDELAEASGGGIEIEYRCDRDRTKPLTAKELDGVVAVISDLELYQRELLGAVGAALTLGLRGGGVLLSLLILPLYTPVLIFGTGAVIARMNGFDSSGHLSLLGAYLLLGLALSPWVTGQALKISLD